ncbi:MAG TPA: hypothetical protein VMG61_12060 [Usitatibacter sp.]|nr:hypothetical protein [Usitatibacter sp.]
MHDLAFIRGDRIARGQLVAEHVASRVRCIGARAPALGHPAEERLLGCLAAHDPERHAALHRECAEALATRPLQERRIDDDRIARAESATRERGEPGVHAVAAGARVDPFPHAGAHVLARIDAVQALSLHVGADANGLAFFDAAQRHRRLARARHAARDLEERTRSARRVQREIDEFASARALPGRRALQAAQVLDLGAHERTIDAVEAQHAKSVVVAAFLEILREQARGEPGQAVGFEIHHEESHVAHHVDPAQPGIELDAIERQGYPAREHDVAEVQVAVALAHETSELAVLHRASHLLEFEQRPFAKARELRGPRPRQVRAFQRGEVVDGEA